MPTLFANTAGPYLGAVFPFSTVPLSSLQADWSRTAIKILSLSDNLGADLNNTLADSQRVRSAIVLKRSSLEHEFNSMDRDLTSQLASMPASLEGMNKLIKKQKESALAERKTREMLIADGFMDPEQAKEVMEDDAALVEIGSQRLKQLLTPLDVPRNDRLEPSTHPSRNSPEHYDDDDASPVLSDNNTNANGGDEDNHARRKPRRRRKRGKKKKSAARNNHNSPLSSSSSSSSSSAHASFAHAPSVESNLDASSRILSIMEAERKRDVFREETLQSLRNNATEYTAMKKIFAKEKKQAEKMIAQMLVEYVPRPITKSSPTKQQAKQLKARFKPKTVTSPSPLTHHRSSSSSGGGLVNQLRESMGRGPQKNFSTTNKMPGAALEVKPPQIPDDVDTETLDLDYKRPLNNNGEPVDAGLRGLIADHTNEMDLNFPEIEKYKKPGQEHALYLEKNLH